MLYGEDIEFLGTETVGMTETVSPSGVSTYGVIPESDMLLTINGVHSLERDITTGRNKIKKMFVFVSYEWFDSKPMVTKQDGITINWDSSLFTLEKDMFTACDYVKYAYAPIEEWIETDMYTNPSEINQGGLEYVANLNHYNENYITIGSRGGAVFSLLPKKTIYSGSGQITSINVRYVHDKNPFWGTVTFLYSGFGVTVNLSGLQDSVAKPFNYIYST